MYMLVLATLSAALPTCSIKYTSKKGLELMRLLTVELCSINKCVLQDLYRSVLCNINAGSITLHEALHDGLLTVARWLLGL